MTSEAPPVIKWFKVYAGFMAALYGLLTLIGLVLVVVSFGDEELGMAERLILASVFLILCGGLTAIFAFALFAPRSSWVWVYDIVLIAIGLTSCLTIPAAVPLLLYWIKPEAKAWFGRT
jgi:hypothetical protein